MPESYRPYRVEVRGQLAARSPFHIGTGQRLSLATDAPILRDESGRPYVPGSTLRGVVRAHLEREAPLLGCTQANVERLFGKAPAKGSEGEASQFGRIVFEDACLAEAASSATEIRDHVRIAAKTGAAADGAKFDSEVALGSPVFSFALFYEGDSPEDPEMRLVREAIRALAKGEIRVGAKSGWGYGAVQLTGTRWAAFHRATPEGLSAWLKCRAGLAQPEWTSEPAGDATPAVNTGNPPQPHLLPLSELIVDLRLRFRGPVLVKAAIPPVKIAEAEDASNPANYGKRGLTVADSIFISRAGDQKFYLPGSSLRGVLRSQGARICATLGKKDLVERLFGEIKQGKGGRKGRIEVGDGEIEGDAAPIYLDHVAIDRITNAAADAKKFATCGLISPAFRVSLRLRVDPEEWDLVALFGLLLRDLLDGRLWIGSGTTRGFGWLASAEIVKARWSDAGMLHTECSRRVTELKKPTFQDLNHMWEKAETVWNPAI
jgi:CRISPR/Cas system CMR subunit Cmr4 (Cas7 group RAMP superfamily)